MAKASRFSLILTCGYLGDLSTRLSRILLLPVLLGLIAGPINQAAIILKSSSSGRTVLPPARSHQPTIARQPNHNPCTGVQTSVCWRTKVHTSAEGRLLYRGLVALFGLALLGFLANDPVAAQTPETTRVKVMMQVIPATSAANPAQRPTFAIGDSFDVAIVAENAPAPGIFGGQFELNYAPAHIQVVAGSVQPGPELEPMMPAFLQVDNVNGLVSYAASRLGNVENVAGRVTLATLSFRSTNSTQGQITTISLNKVKLAAKGGLTVPVSEVANLELIVADVANSLNQATIEGRALVEGRAADNQAGSEVVAVGQRGQALMATTDSMGSFILKNAPADIYTLTIRRAGFLAVTCVVELSDQASLGLDSTVLPAGDINGDGAIDVADAAAIGAVFGQAGSGEAANLDGRDEVNILDLILLAGNFGRTGLEGCPNVAAE
jgi:hypothetical protein